MEIRLATRDDVEDIMAFIRDYWKADHILATDRDFFEWMYVNGDSCSYEIAKHEGKIYGILGFIPYSQKDPVDAGSSIWKAIPCEAEPFVGLKINDELHKIGLRHYIPIGLNRKAGRLAKYNGFSIVPMQQYYRLSEQDNYQIAVVNDNTNLDITEHTGICKRITGIEEFERIAKDEWLIEQPVYKSRQYLIHRFLRHPIYRYDCYSICDSHNQLRGLLFGRKVQVGDTAMYKIIDYVGKPEYLCYIGDTMQTLIQEEHLEYIDLYSYGVTEETMAQAGFRLRRDDKNIIPNYFEPFVQENVEIYVQVPDEPIAIFRGDGDMDRPNHR